MGASGAQLLCHGDVIFQVVFRPVEIEEIVSTCPVCDQGDIIIQGGQELLLQSIELEDEDPVGEPSPGDG